MPSPKEPQTPGCGKRQSTGLKTRHYRAEAQSGSGVKRQRAKSGSGIKPHKAKSDSGIKPLLHGERGTEFAGGEGVEGAEAVGEFGSGNALLAVEAS